MNRIIFITGSTSGIGKATAELFAQNGDHLILAGRREERLKQLSHQLQEKNNIRVHPVVLDVCNRKAVFDAVDKLPEEWQSIDILINNAGLALGRDSFQDADLQDMDTMMQTNVNGLMYATKAVVTGMVKRKRGHIINIGSVAAKEVYANGNAYCASKFAVDALTKGMRIDLLPLGIKVTAIHPGAVDTEFSLVRYKGDAEKADATYKGFRPLVAEDVAQSILYTANLPAHICINEMTITCTAQADVHHFHKDK